METTWHPDQIYPESIWERIEVFRPVLSHGRDGMPQFGTCQECGDAADHMVDRMSSFSGRSYRDFWCDRHIKRWLPPNREMTG